MKPIIISWNVKELNNRDKRLRVSSLLRDWKVDIVYTLSIQEIHLTNRRKKI